MPIKLYTIINSSNIRLWLTKAIYKVLFPYLYAGKSEAFVMFIYSVYIFQSKLGDKGLEIFNKVCYINQSLREKCAKTEFFLVLIFLYSD